MATSRNADATTGRRVELGDVDVRVVADGKEGWIEPGLPGQQGAADR